ncbi:MAG: hypothetical protein HY911_09850 [Desulfobacterales bacterium]|nr:hypothetical protein [Desulfobacterales bacterium]
MSPFEVSVKPWEVHPDTFYHCGTEFQSRALEDWAYRRGDVSPENDDT